MTASQETFGESVKLDQLRVVFGFILAPFVAVVIALLTYDALFYAGFLPHGALIASADAAESLGMGVGILAVLITGGGALPVFIALRLRNRLSFRNLIAAGAVLGNIPLMLIVAGIVIAQLGSEAPDPNISRYWEGWSGLIVRMALGVACGSGTAAAFWVVAVWKTHFAAETQQQAEALDR